MFTSDKISLDNISVLEFEQNEAELKFELTNLTIFNEELSTGTP